MNFIFQQQQQQQLFHYYFHIIYGSILNSILKKNFFEFNDDNCLIKDSLKLIILWLQIEHLNCFSNDLLLFEQLFNHYICFRKPKQMRTGSLLNLSTPYKTNNCTQFFFSFPLSFIVCHDQILLQTRKKKCVQVRRCVNLIMPWLPATVIT